jgi:hypothetical protein
MDASMFRKLHEPTSPVTIAVDGAAVTAAAGGRPRAPYCMMGVCFDCLAIVDGVPSTQTCRTAVREGMRVERQHGARVIGQ